ncbi:MAG: hypothetical protein JWN04_6671 [Myxococcaceae bacterium]|nr:hypothetical protein [Myxococcaceae bacterium]
MSLLRALDRFWYMPAPAARLAVLRALVGSYALVYLLIRSLSLTAVTSFDPASFEPVGPVRLLAAPLPTWLVQLAVGLACLSGAAFVGGFRYRISAPLFALTFLWVTSYRSSWGMIFHTENLVALHLLLLAAAPAADAFSFDARAAAWPQVASGRYGWAIRAISTITVASYALAGVAKLRLAGTSWAGGDVLRAQVAYDNLRKIELGSTHSPLGAWLVVYAWPFRGLAWVSLALELGAPLALLGGPVARLWVLGAFSFHIGVVALMAIGFPYQLSLIAYASFFPLERALDLPAWRRLRARLAKK